jgi:hypothetical protein
MSHTTTTRLSLWKERGGVHQKLWVHIRFLWLCFIYFRAREREREREREGGRVRE